MGKYARLAEIEAKLSAIAQSFGYDDAEFDLASVIRGGAQVEVTARTKGAMRRFIFTLSDEAATFPPTAYVATFEHQMTKSGDLKFDVIADFKTKEAMLLAVAALLQTEILSFVQEMCEASPKEWVF